MSIKRLLGWKKPATTTAPPIPEVTPPPPVLEDTPAPLSPMKPMSLQSVFLSGSMDSHSPAAPSAVTGVLPHIGPLPFRSESCSSHHFLLSCYQHWCNEIKQHPTYHRKQWEFVYILQALWERGLLELGKRGLGFGVGREPLTAVMAAHGCKVLATDIDADSQSSEGWADTGQHSTTLEDLNAQAICEEGAFKENVSFAPVDMNNIPSDLRGFDFCWSACCFEHLGSIKAGLEFYKNSIECLKPGGFVIHTTELNMSSNEQTLDNDATVLFRRRDLEELIADLRAQGHYCEPLLVHYGSQPVDGFIDMPPYRIDPHLRLAIAQYVSTSVGIITRKALG